MLMLLANAQFLEVGDIRDGGGCNALNAISKFIFVAAIIIIATSNNLKSVPGDVYMRRPAVVITGCFVLWAMLTTLWSPNPLLTLDKSVLLGLFTIVAVLISHECHQRTLRHHLQ